MAGRLPLRALAVAAPVVVAVGATLLGAGGGRAVAQSEEPSEAELVETGRELYATGCSSCHGDEGEGIEIVDGQAGGPSLENAGEAGAYYYLTTGRMPLANPGDQPRRKDPAYSPEQIDALVAYVASLGDGPELPDVDVDGADLAAGGVVFRANCQACHSASGSGGALSYGDAAPRLAESTPAQVGAAVRIGPGEMPVFGPDTITEEQLDALAGYVRYLQDPEDPGGLPIGRTGPIPEGFVAWLIGMGAMVGFVYWIGTRNPVERPVVEGEEDRG
ncbi:MAG TPA: c-type cytochrome [Acidimicrobiales bacterium]